MSENIIVYRPKLLAFFNWKILIPFIIVSEWAYRVWGLPYFDQMIPAMHFIWILGPNVIFIPLSFLRLWIFYKKNMLSFLNVTVYDDSVEGLSNLKNLGDAVSRANRLLSDVSELNYNEETREALHPIIRIKIDDIDWARSFKTEIFLWPRIGLGVFKKIYARDGQQIILHWLLGDQQIDQLKKHLLAKRASI